MQFELIFKDLTSVIWQLINLQSHHTTFTVLVRLRKQQNSFKNAKCNSLILFFFGTLRQF